MAQFYNNIGITFSEEKEFGKGFRHSVSAYDLAKEIGVIETQKLAAQSAYQNARELGRYQDAFHYFTIYAALKDSMDNQENLNELQKQKYQYEYDLKATADSLTHARDIVIRDAELEKSRIGLGLLAMALLAFLLGGLVIYQKYGVVRRQRDLIQTQKGELEKKNKSVLDSIRYAQRIQGALLPSLKKVTEIFPDSFILYKPKDIVAGDFYWLDQQGNRILFAVADCTGHGVPGALVSVICIAGLRRAVKELQLTDPAEILNQTREFILSEFHKSAERVDDGMDISLACLEKDSMMLHWSGAMNPLYIWREGELIQLAGDRFPVGAAPEVRPFSRHRIQLNQGDMLFLLTDGYADQFNGRTGKKFTTPKLRALLREIGHLTPGEQVKELTRRHTEWRGEKIQVDDICIWGIRI